jgi:peptidoglycan/LPS O-acetylase OafA/YrhL
MGPIFNISGVSLLALLFGALLILVTTAEPGSRLHRFFGSAFLRVFGKYSYGLYLIHLPLRALIRDRIYGPSDRDAWIHYPRLFGSELPGQMLFYMVAGGASLAAAWVSFQLFESQFLKLKRFFPSGARSRSTSKPLP